MEVTFSNTVSEYFKNKSNTVIIRNIERAIKSLFPTTRLYRLHIVDINLPLAHLQITYRKHNSRKDNYIGVKLILKGNEWVVGTIDLDYHKMAYFSTVGKNN